MGARARSGSRAPDRIRRRHRSAVRDSARERRSRGHQATAADVRSRRLGAGRVGDRRPSRRPALAVRIGRRHHRAARRHPARPGRDLGRRHDGRRQRPATARTPRSRCDRRRDGGGRAAVAAGADPAHSAGTRRRRRRNGARSIARHSRCRLGDAGGIAAPRPGYGRRHRDPGADRSAGCRDRRAAQPAGLVACAAPQRATPLPAGRSRANRRAAAGAVQCRRRSALPHRLARAFRGVAGARGRDWLDPRRRRTPRQRRNR